MDRIELKNKKNVYTLWNVEKKITRENPMQIVAKNWLRKCKSSSGERKKNSRWVRNNAIDKRDCFSVRARIDAIEIYTFLCPLHVHS